MKKIAGAVVLFLLIISLFSGLLWFSADKTLTDNPGSQLGQAVGSTLVRAPYKDSNGWTVITPSTDTRKVYVSASQGSDTNDGLSESTPVKTIAKARTLMRYGYPDWMLLKKGDSWNECLGHIAGSATNSLSGRSANEPMVFTSYGTGKRPQLKVDDTTGNCFRTNGGNNKGGDYLAVLGWEIYAHDADPASPSYNPSRKGNGGAVFMLNDVNWFLAEDVWFRGTGTAFQDQGSDPMSNITIRRNIFTSGNSNFNTHVKNLVFEENIFNKSDWYTQDQQTIFKRSLYNAYGDGKTIFRGNIDADGSSGGIQLRYGGVVEDNLFVKSPIAITIGSTENHLWGVPVPATVQNNVILDSRNINTAPRGFGMWVTSAEKTSKKDVVGPPSIITNAKFNSNIIANNKNGGGNVHALNFDGGGHFVNVEVKNNIIYNWIDPVKKNGTALKVSVSADALQKTTKFNYSGNIIQYPDGNAGSFVSVSEGVLNAGSPFSFSGNKVWASNGVKLPSAGFTATKVNFKDPNRSLDTYMASLGLSGGYDEFMRRATQMSKDNWDKRFTAAAVNAYIKDGFTIVSENTDTSVVPLPQPTAPTTTPPSSPKPATTTNQTSTGNQNNNNNTNTNNPTPDNQLPNQGSGVASGSSAVNEPKVRLPRVNLEVDKKSVRIGESVTLSWSSANANSCSASGGWSGSKGLTGKETITPAKEGKVIYIITCTDGSEYGSDSAVVVISTGVPIVGGNVGGSPISNSNSANKLSVGQKVTVIDDVRVRKTAGGDVLAIKSKGSLGTVKTEPKRIGDYDWVYVDFVEGADGYVAVSYLKISNSSSVNSGVNSTGGMTLAEKEALIAKLQLQLTQLLQLYQKLISQQ